jgi:acetate---CoA ligase (ADP-forming)
MSVMSESRRAASLTAALAPQSIAIIGASDNRHKVGGRPLMYLSRFGFAGRVYPVNPARDVVQGVKAYADVASLPEAPDLAVVAVPAAQTPDAVRACAARGVKAAILLSSGFGETLNDSAGQTEAQMVADARAAGMRIIGPNSQGMANFGTGAVASFSTMFIEVAPADGPVGIVSQSGVMSVVPYGLLRGRGVGVRHAHASGNDADVTLSELTLAVVQDPEIRLVLLYIESIRDPHVLAEAAAIARERDVPIVAVKSGRTARGAQAARTHTGALASDDAVVDVFLRKHGVWRVDDVHELVRTAELYLKGWRPLRRDLVIVSNSGASGVMAADTAHRHGLPLANFDELTRSALAAELPDFATVTNPIDITAALLTESRLFSNLLPLLARQREGELFLLAIPVAGEGYDIAAFARDAAAFAADIAKPVVVAAPQETVAGAFRATGVITFANQSDAIAALAQLADHAALLRQRPPDAWTPPLASLGPRVRVASDMPRLLTEAESLALLRSHGLPVVPFAHCRTEDDAAEAFARFGPAVVLKACSADVPHKSDFGLVMLGLTGVEEVRDACRVIATRLRDHKFRHDGVLVARMEHGGHEVALGARIDRTFGPVVMVSAGGRYVEAMPDTALLLPPFDAREARAAWQSLRMAPLFAGVRGEPALDLDALCHATVQFGRMVAALSESIASIDVNPVVVRTAGNGVVIVDALVESAA